MKSNPNHIRRVRFGLALSLFAFASCLSLRAQEPTADDFTSSNDAEKKVFLKESGGIRIKTPAPIKVEPKPGVVAAPKEGRAAAPPRLWYLDTTYAVEGDFEYSVNYVVTELGTKTGTMPGEANAEIGVIGRGALGHLALNVNVDPKAGKRFNVVRISPNVSGLHFNIQAFPRTSDVGKLRVKRVKDEVVFLVADGADAAFKELVRYPYDPKTQPNFRVSAHHYQGAEANPVNVLFSGIAVKADKIVRGPKAGYVPSPAPAPTSYPVTIDYGANPGGFFTDFKHTDDKSQTFRIEGDGLRVRPPTPAYKKGAQGYYFRESRYSVVGDMEWSCRYQADKLGPLGEEGYGSCAVSIQLESQTPLGSLALSIGATRSMPLRHGITRHSSTAKGGVWDTQEIRAKFKSGIMSIRRTGNEVTLSILGDGETEAMELCRVPWTAAPIKRLRLSIDQGGNCSTPVDVKLSQIRVRAQSFVDEASGQQLAVSVAASRSNENSSPPIAGETGVVLQAAPEAKSNKWSYLILGAFLLGVALVGILVALAVVMLRKRK